MSTLSSPSTHLDRPSAPAASATRWFDRLLATRADIGPTIARLMLGVVMFPHGAQKMLGWFGGSGFGDSMGHFAHSGIPAVFAFLAIVAEFFGSIGLIAGALSRIAAFGIGVNMIVAIALVHGSQGFFMNWFGNKSGEGFEYHLLAIALAAIVFIKGAGRWSIDGWVSRRS